MRKPLIGGICLLVILFATCRLWPERRRVTTKMTHRPRVCEACGHRFSGVTDPVLLACPRCGKRAGVRVHHYACRQCSKRFEAFWERPADPALQAPDPRVPPPMVYKRPDGDWVPSVQELGPIPCPACDSTDTGPPPPQCGGRPRGGNT